jgi:hypothetical protein
MSAETVPSPLREIVPSPKAEVFQSVARSAEAANPPVHPPFRWALDFRVLRHFAHRFKPVALQLANDAGHGGIIALVTRARGERALVCDGGSATLVQSKELPTDRLAAHASAAHLPAAHDGAASLRSPPPAASAPSPRSGRWPSPSAAPQPVVHGLWASRQSSKGRWPEKKISIPPADRPTSCRCSR